MARKPIPKVTETAVLTQSRRRCCICFGLDRDTQLKSGQIAHLDRDSSNHSESNLAFLCFYHHDEYDSISSQRKRLTIGEVKQFRDELHRTINKAFTQQVHFGQITTSPTDPFAGSWIRIGSDDCSAELTLTPLPDTFEGEVQYYMSGLALWAEGRPYGPNLGILEFVGVMTDFQKIIYKRQFEDQLATTTLTFFRDGTLSVSEVVQIGTYGMGVTFEGIYRRAT